MQYLPKSQKHDTWTQILHKKKNGVERTPYLNRWTVLSVSKERFYREWKIKAWAEKNPTFGRLKVLISKIMIFVFQICHQENINPILLGVLLVPSFSTLFLELAFIFLRVLSLKMKIPLFAQNKFPSKKVPCFILILCGNTLVTVWNICKALMLEEQPSLAQCPVLSEKKNERQGKHTVYSYYADFFQPGEADSSSNVCTHLIKA